MYERTPLEITADVRNLCQKVSPNENPFYIGLNPSPQAEEFDCFLNVPDHCVTNGGEVVYGWRIWEWPRIMVEAEFHAVWKNENGEWVDITPVKIKEKRILFLPDPRMKYEGFSVNNIRVSIQDDPLIDEFISICDGIFAVMNKGERKYQHGLIGIPAEEIEPLQEDKIRYQLTLIQRYLRDDDPCPCGSGKKSKLCHPKRRNQTWWS